MLNGITRDYVEGDESFLYYIEDMLNNNVLIEESTVENTNNKMDTIISVLHYNENDACEHVLYWDAMLAPIQSFRIIEDTVKLFKRNTLSEFLDIVNELSINSIASSYQSDESHAKNIMEDIRSTFEMVLD